MVDYINAKELEYGETNDDEVEQDKAQIIDTSVKVEEHRGKQPTIVTRIEVETDDMVVGESDVTIVLTVHDDMDGEPRVEVCIKTLELGPL